MQNVPSRQGCRRYSQVAVTRLVAVWEVAYHEHSLTASDDPFPSIPAPAILGRLADEVGLPINSVRKWWANRNNFKRRQLLFRGRTRSFPVQRPLSSHARVSFPEWSPRQFSLQIEWTSLEGPFSMPAVASELGRIANE